MRRVTGFKRESRATSFRPRGLRSLIGIAGLAIGVGGAQGVVAQETVLVASPITNDYDRGRNVSVVEKPRPDFDPLGVRRGSFDIFPRLGIDAGASSNVYLTVQDRVSDAFFAVTPGIVVRSDWSKHQLVAAGGGSFRRYVSQTPRNQDEWYINALGRADVTSEVSFTVEAQAAKAQEAPFTGAVLSNVAALSSYNRQMLAARGQFISGRTRTTLAYDYTSFEFDDVVFGDGARLPQADRDRKIHRATGQLEYALSPSLSIFGQANVSKTDYSRTLFNGESNRDSTAYRVLGGFNFDLTAFMRGSIGAGYVSRGFDSTIYKDVGGLSLEARLEYFPTQLTTVTLNARRLLDDANIGSTGALFDSQVSVRVDHELLYNLLINAGASYARQNFLNSSFRSDIGRVLGGVRYLVSRSVQIQANVGYASRSDNGSINALRGGDIREISGQVGIILQR